MLKKMSLFLSLLSTTKCRMEKGEVEVCLINNLCEARETSRVSLALAQGHHNAEFHQIFTAGEGFGGRWSFCLSENHMPHISAPHHVLYLFLSAD